MKKTVMKIVAVIIILAIAGGGAYYYFGMRSTPVDTGTEVYKEATAKNGTIRISFPSDGKASLPVLKLRFPVSGQLKELLADVGDEIQKDSVIATLEDSDYNEKISSSSINVEQAVVKLQKTKETLQSQLLAEKSKVDNLKFQMDSLELAYKPMLEIPDAYTAQEIEAKKISYENAKKVYESELAVYEQLQGQDLDTRLDELAVEQSKATLTSAKASLADTQLKSPVDGQVLYISSRPGESISNNSDFAIVTDAGRLSVQALVSELDVAKIVKDQRVEIEFEAMQGKSYTGTVLSVDPLPVADSSGIVNYTVNIGLEDADDSIRDGMTCAVSFVLKEKQDVLIIPNKAVKIIDGNQTVEVKSKDGTISSRTIKTGLTDGTNVEVTEGLTAGEILILRN